MNSTDLGDNKNLLIDDYIDDELLKVYGARVHNLKNIDVVIPRNKLVVITGLSGSGKSSLAFDTIYAEGQRRYMETFSAYARQFIGDLERPEVDKITGLSPVISIEQKTIGRNPRSTVGTVTEIYDFLRLLYARIGDAYSYVTGKKMVHYSETQIIDLILEKHKDKNMIIMASLVKGRKGHYRELFEQIFRHGFTKVRVDGKVIDLEIPMQLDRYKTHDIEIVVDRIKVNDENRSRLIKSVQVAMKQGKGTIMVLDNQSQTVEHLSRSLMCLESGISYDEPEPNTFSFNSPYGACPKCNGLGIISEISLEKIIPDSTQNIRQGGLAPVGPFKNTWIFKQLEAIGHKHNYTLDTPLEELHEEALSTILYGTDEVIKVKNEYLGVTSSYSIKFEGIVNFIVNQDLDSGSAHLKKWAGSFMNTVTCPECLGSRLKKESLYFKIEDKNIADLASMGMGKLLEWFTEIESRFDERKKAIGTEIIREIKNRIHFLLDVGIDYLTLNRPARSLSGGESQRIRLATQIGSQLVGVLYILDEPSIGLHQRDNLKLIRALRDLRDIGNSIIVVEHDEDMIRSADHIIDIGPGAGILGGKIVAQGSPTELLNSNSVTCQYLNKIRKIEIPQQKREGNGEYLILKGASGNNLKNVELKIPLGKFICVTGVSGSGKSTLINQTLYPVLSKHFYHSEKMPLPYDTIEGLKNIDKVIEIDQSPIGRTPRSNPATYTGVFTEIRNLFSLLPESKIRGYKAGRFSFNVKGGRCDECEGAGLKLIEMNFLPDVFVPCESCQGKRYNRETLELRYKGKSISDVLEMNINQAVEFFENIPSLILKMKTLRDVGLGYITLGQSSTTLSGGEAQRVKLATELSKRDTGKTLYILDEPTTGLHFEDVKILLEVLNRLVDKGNTIIVIEHNMEVIKVSDHIIDIGPEGGLHGGMIIAEGKPEIVAQVNQSYTGVFLKEIFDNNK